MREIRNNKKNNKGFSLVELIIVIAIMAVLVGTLAPQYLRYVERSKVATDMTIVDQMVTSLQVLAADPDANLVTTSNEGDPTYVISSAANAETIRFTNGLTSNTIYASIVDLNVDESGNSQYEFTSASYIAANITISLVYDATNHIWEVNVTGQPE